ncbi:MAG: hydroxymethylglutaryl-CoA reductase, degradative [Candidatus Poseidoniia archaeon]|jgi:hydroxymethylglutaryl-CoA reductase|nr:hydroxymethylglutaryl-CoA reductase, degradative [Candidatus Poseidoniia archaeon]MDP7082023.1 hydroxymethylglutaryl-CoA reductase, degradative [Candidatus Poseidoniia archaeon]MDP7255692.1 hydroxymethylglutaryl-CoA reductase, degradative [Candidatus Poseidoniia archaeon]MDP7473710.1 hydroxymethylglutaryl-CoA reductase, degradative [Candidatus Poseidoniia archaeon]MDP7538314.1 hydroxymethylglutaryl-CoA reductase, degradative [Candidatus Poseidoniia archaeon]|tara:strand:- start:11783 stop:13057 length:1275 start_codon:yes stop_codon:yes gene_type:complete
MARTSAVPGFYKLSPAERLEIVKEFASLSDEEAKALGGFGALGGETANRMIENVIGSFPMPLGVAANFKVNGEELFVPMALEEPSVVAAASNMAKGTLPKGIAVDSDEPVMIGQIQLVDLDDAFAAKATVEAAADEIVALANEQDPILVKFGGGCRGIEVRVLDSAVGPMVITHLLVDCRDAMGANAVNTMAEAVAPRLETLTGGRVYLRIISNLAVHRKTRASAIWPAEFLGGEEVVDGIIAAYAFACADPFRVATHNKGIMNGIDPVVIATGNDWRAIEAGAHSYGGWKEGDNSFTDWEKTDSGDLHGSIELPMAVGLVGGATATHPTARACVKMMGLEIPGGAEKLAGIIAAVGLCQNLGALRALASEGIQRGHMGLHARNLAVAAGAEDSEIDAVAERLKREGKVRADLAEQFLKELREG